MWALNNQTPFAAERGWVRDKNGAEVWIVAVKGSFLIQSDGKQILDQQQSEISRVPEFSGQPGLSSLLYESDLEHKKSQTDVILLGHAYAPGGDPITKVDVTLKVANISKTLRVIGDRVWQNSLLGMKMSKPEPFTKIPLSYERAFGGTDQFSPNPKHHKWEPRNPVGVGFATSAAHLIEKPVPNVEDPKSPILHWKSRPKPVGFGPIARHWTPRVKLAGTYDEAWEKTRSPLLPADFDEQFYQVAPEDQQVPGFLKGGEIVEIYNLTPEGYLSFELPRVTFGMTTRFYDGAESTHRAALHTLIIQPDERRFQMVWHSHLPCHHKVNQLEETSIVLKKRLNVSRATLEAGVWIEA